MNMKTDKMLYAERQIKPEDLDCVSWLHRIFPFFCAILAFIGIVVWQINGEPFDVVKFPTETVTIVALNEPSSVITTPVLLTENGQCVQWKASLQKLSSICSNGFPYALDVTSRYGELLFLNLLPSLFWIIGGVTILMATTPLVIWKYRYVGSKRIAINLAEPLRSQYVKKTFYCLLILLLAALGVWFYYFRFRFWFIGMLIIPIAWFIYGIFKQGKTLGVLLILFFLFLSVVFFRMLLTAIRDYPITNEITSKPLYINHSSSYEDGETLDNYTIFVRYFVNSETRYATISLTSKRSEDLSLINLISSPKLPLHLSNAGRVFARKSEHKWMLFLGLIGTILFGMLSLKLIKRYRLLDNASVFL